MRRYFLLFFTIGICFLACEENSREAIFDALSKGPLNPYLPAWLSLSKSGQSVYNHSVIKGYRGRSDCQPNCPAIDVWQYQLKGHLPSTEPISTKQENWKIKSEARIIATTLFGSKEKYVNGFFNLLKSNQSLMRANGVRVSNGELWGYDTFQFRVYIAKRNPKSPNQNSIQNATPDIFIERLLDAGCEIAFVDNGLDSVGGDATFWRFMIMGENMPQGQSLRYLIRDIDWLFTGAEAFGVAEWIASNTQFHRNQLLPTCISPMSPATLLGGSHTGISPFQDINSWMLNYPYRIAYGDDEMFLRDRVWPIQANSGSILTHYFDPDLFTLMGEPYENSCGRPTQKECDGIQKSNGHGCADVIFPSGISYPYIQLGTLEDTNDALGVDSYFSMATPGNERGARAIKALYEQKAGP